MNPVTHQTVKLARGQHSSPDQGVCVMELASMLAGEKFSDHPESVCPVIGTFLRTYNDAVGDERRQALYSYAAKVVGSRGSAEVAQARIEHLRCIVVELRLKRQPWSRWLPAPMKRPMEMIASRAATMIAEAEGKRELSALRVVDDLLALGRIDRARPPAGSGADHDRDSEPERMLRFGDLLKASH